jgi:hypothetical protein
MHGRLDATLETRVLAIADSRRQRCHSLPVGFERFNTVTADTSVSSETLDHA